MKILHCYIPHKQPNAGPKKELVYLALLSALYAKKHYGNISLFTNKAQEKFFKRLNLPYDEINTSLEGTNNTVYSFPKMTAMCSQNEPYAVIDMDTIILDKIDLDKKEVPYFFSHPDVTPVKYSINGEPLVDDLFSHLSQEKLFLDYYKTYLKFYLEGLITPGRMYSKDFHMDNMPSFYIPNYNVVGVNDPQGMKNAIEKMLDVYQVIKELADREYYSACFLEQYCITHYLRLDNEKFRNSFLEKDWKDTPFLFKGEPWSMYYSEYDKITYPFEVEYHSINNIGHNKDVYINHKHKDIYNNEKDFLGKLNLSNYPFIHFCGNTKWYDYIQAMVIGEIVDNFGEDLVYRVCREYQKAGVGISRGEMLYDKLSGRKIFTKKSVV